MASSRKSPRDSTLLARVTAVLRRYVRRGDRLVVGLSGGFDSVVLLDLLQRAARRLGFRLAAVHVNHQLNPSAGAWATFCRVLCRGYAIALTVKRVEVRRGNSLEAAARAARYGVYASLRSDAIVLAHNLDDQAETLLLQLLRGTGLKGASAMPEYRVEDRGSRIENSATRTKAKHSAQSSIRNPALLRPLLDVPRSEIAAYARTRKLAWIEDDSNADTAFDRNFVRHQVLPAIAGRFPAYRQTLSRASRHFAEAAELADGCAMADAGDCGNLLDLGRLRVLSAARVKNALRYFLARKGILMPNARRLDECVRQLLQSGAGAGMTMRLGDYELRCYGDQLHVIPVTAKMVAPFAQRAWRGESRLQLPELGGVLSMTPRRGAGISLEQLAGGNVTVRVRQGGERLQIDRARPRRTLKNLWQEARIPEWRRGRLPLLFVGDKLAFVAGIGVASAFQARTGEPGIEPDWRPALG